MLDGASPWPDAPSSSPVRDALKAATRRGRHDSLESSATSDLLHDRQPGPEALWEQAETAEEVWAALGRVSPEQRAAIVARYFLGMSEAEMSQALACPPSTVKWRFLPLKTEDPSRRSG